jgi:glutamyl-tRNA synthetase
MVAFLFTTDDALVIDDEARGQLRDQAPEVLDRAIETLKATEDWSASSLEAALRAVLVEQMEISPRHAFTPLRVAISGRRVSPPLFESMEILGRESSMARLGALRQSL